MGMRFDAVVRSNATALRAYPADAALTRVTTGTMRLLAVIVLAMGLSFSPWASAMMSCFVNSVDVTNAPADGDTLCWADEELPKNARDIELELDSHYPCDPGWAACSGFFAALSGGAGAGGSNPGGFFFTLGARYRENPGDTCCSGAFYTFIHDANAKPRAAHSPVGKNTGPPSCPVRAGNPIHVGTGNNYNRARDYLGAGVFPLRFEHHYNSILGVQSRRDGWRWRHTYERRLFLDGSEAILLRETGRAHYFVQTG